MAQAAKIKGEAGKLTEAVSRYYYKLMAYKDEYEVARLYTDGQFLAQIKNTFDGDYKLEFNLAPPLLAKRDPLSGKLQKMKFGPWMLGAFGVLAKLRFLRGTPLDPFGASEERRLERRLIDRYRARIADVASRLTAENLNTAIEIAAVPDEIRGYGPVKLAAIEKAEKRFQALLRSYNEGRADKAA